MTHITQFYINIFQEDLPKMKELGKRFTRCSKDIRTKVLETLFNDNPNKYPFLHDLLEDRKKSIMIPSLLTFYSILTMGIFTFKPKIIGDPFKETLAVVTIASTLMLFFTERYFMSYEEKTQPWEKIAYLMLLEYDQTTL